MQSFLIQQFEACFSEKRLQSCDLFWRRWEEAEALLLLSITHNYYYYYYYYYQGLTELWCQWQPENQQTQSSAVRQCPSESSIPTLYPGRETIQVDFNDIKHFFPVPGTYCRSSDCAGAPGWSSFRLQGSMWGTPCTVLGQCCWRTWPSLNKKFQEQVQQAQWEWDTVFCTGSVLLKDTVWLKQEIWNAACLTIQLLPTTLPKQVLLLRK